MKDKTALSYWFPKIQTAVPTPKTEILIMPQEIQDEIRCLLWGEKADMNAAQPFFSELAVAADRMGLPCFIRTGHTSGKHSWGETCFLRSISDIPRHVIRLAEFSEAAGIIGLDWHEWVVRELLPTVPFGTCPRYNNMPICREFRYFVDNDVIRCRHPYWPLPALKRGGAPSTLDYAKLCSVTEEEEAKLSCLAIAVGKAVGGSWSVDILETQRGWYVTDMAEADKSFHWEGCS